VLSFKLSHNFRYRNSRLLSVSVQFPVNDFVVVSLVIVSLSFGVADGMDVIETLFLIARGGRYIAVDTCRLVDELVVTIYAVEFNRLVVLQSPLDFAAGTPVKVTVDWCFGRTLEQFVNRRLVRNSRSTTTPTEVGHRLPIPSAVQRIHWFLHRLLTSPIGRSTGSRSTEPRTPRQRARRTSQSTAATAEGTLQPHS